MKGLPLTKLAIHTAKANLNQGGVNPDDVHPLVFDNTLPMDSDGLCAFRVVELGAGLAEDSPHYCDHHPFDGEYMGGTVENLTEEFQYKREAMNEWALMS